jgi:hypothetical protein
MVPQVNVAWEQIKMKLHPANPTPGIVDLPPAPPKEPVTTADLVGLCGAVLTALQSTEMEARGGMPRRNAYLQMAWDKLNSIKGRL